MVSLGATLHLDAGAPERIRAASRARQAAERQARAVRDQARHDVRAAYSRLLAVREQEAALREAVEAGRESFRLTEERHREGLATTLELTESQTTLTRVSLQWLSARQETALAHQRLRLVSGLLGGE